jgi:hypothetical protein
MVQQYRHKHEYLLPAPENNVMKAYRQSGNKLRALILTLDGTRHLIPVALTYREKHICL